MSIRVNLINGTYDTNTAFGIDSLEEKKGDFNTVMGYQALQSNNTGNNNVAIGYQSLQSNVLGDYNIAIGSKAGSSNTGNNNVAIGYDSGSKIQSGNDNICIGNNTDTSQINATNQMVIGNGTMGTGNNEIALGNVSITAIKAQVTSITSYSDKRIKKNIITNDLGLDFITKLRPVKYNKVNPADYPEELLEKRFKGDNPSERPEDDDNIYDGLIAQEVESALEPLGKSWSGHSVNESDGKQGLQYGILVIPLINAVQELTKRIEILEKSS